MSLDCYWCEEHIPVIANPSGPVNRSLGCCKNCQVFACGHHAQRDNYAKEYICFNCDTSILIASGNVLSQNDDLDQIAKVAVQKIFGKRKYGINYFLEEIDLFSSYDDFKKRRSGYKDWFGEIELFANHFTWENPEIIRLFNYIPLEAQLLFVAAAVIIIKTSAGTSLESTYPFYIVQLTDEIKASGSY